MSKSNRLWMTLALASAGAVLACSEASPDDSGNNQNTGAAPGTGATASGVGGSGEGSGGFPGVGGAGTGSAPTSGGSGGFASGGTGGFGTGGDGSGGGGSGGDGSGGDGTGGLGTGGDGTGGEASGGTGGEASGGSGGGSGGGNSSPATPSAGCGKGGRPGNGSASGNNYIANFPESYNGTTPMPLLVALHANANPNTQLQNLTNNTRLASNFVRVFPKSTGQGWVYNTDVSRVRAAYDDILNNYCVDTSRVFLTGHSSGAQMGVQMLCNGETRFAGIAPVAASKYCNSVAAIPTMYIQGIQDAQRGGSNGKDVVDVFASSNSCSNTTTPFSEVMGCNSTFNQKAVNPGCVSYQSCGEPLIWCSHNDEGYNNSDGRYHGWPCFASNAMADFFLSLP